MEHQADVHPQLRLILPDAGPGCEKNGRGAKWPVTTRSGRHQVPVAVLPTAKSLSAFSLKPQSDRLLGARSAAACRNATAATVFPFHSAGTLCVRHSSAAATGFFARALNLFARIES